MASTPNATSLSAPDDREEAAARSRAFDDARGPKISQQQGEGEDPEARSKKACVLEKEKVS